MEHERPSPGFATRTLTFGGTTIALAYTSGRPSEIVQFLFKHLPRGFGTATTSARPGLTLSENPTDGALTLSSRGAVCCVDRSAAAVASWLLHAACSQLAEGSADGLLLHAAAVRWRGRSLLLPGATGSGKSTLAAYLATKGFDCLTDELAYVPVASNCVDGFRVPLKIKKSGLDALQGHVRLTTDSARRMAGHFDVLLAPDVSERESSNASLSVIVFPQYRARSRFSLTPLSPSQTAVRLMTSVLNAAKLPDHGFREATRVARLAAGYDMRFANLGQVGAHIERFQSMTSSGSGARLTEHPDSQA